MHRTKYARGSEKIFDPNIHKNIMLKSVFFSLRIPCSITNFIFNSIFNIGIMQWNSKALETKIVTFWMLLPNSSVTIWHRIERKTRLDTCSHGKNRNYAPIFDAMTYGCGAKRVMLCNFQIQWHTSKATISVL